MSANQNIWATDQVGQHSPVPETQVLLDVEGIMVPFILNGQIAPPGAVSFHQPNRAPNNSEPVEREVRHELTVQDFIGVNTHIFEWAQPATNDTGGRRIVSVVVDDIRVNLHTDVLESCQVFRDHLEMGWAPHVEISLSFPGASIHAFVILILAMYGVKSPYFGHQVYAGESYVKALELCYKLECSQSIYDTIVRCFKAHLGGYKDWMNMPADSLHNPYHITSINDINATYTAYKEHIRRRFPPPFSKHSFASLVWQYCPMFILSNHGHLLNEDITRVVTRVAFLQRQINFDPFETFPEFADFLDAEIDRLTHPQD